jgi:hypothetical protein
VALARGLEAEGYLGHGNTIDEIVAYSKRLSVESNMAQSEEVGRPPVSAYSVGRNPLQPIESRRYCPGVFPYCRLKALLKDESDS